LRTCDILTPFRCPPFPPPPPAPPPPPSPPQLAGEPYNHTTRLPYTPSQNLCFNPHHTNHKTQQSFLDNGGKKGVALQRSSTFPALNLSKIAIILGSQFFPKLRSVKKPVWEKADKSQSNFTEVAEILDHKHSTYDYRVALYRPTRT
jgi:hypothetical protein